MKPMLTLCVAAATFALAASVVAQPVTLESAPPVVVKTMPVAGATDVDPSLKEMRVTYSKPMQDGIWSWSTWGAENYPETTGTPKYLADGKTCVLPVQLQPGKFYALWLNSEKFKNFKDVGGRPAVPYLLTFHTAETGRGAGLGSHAVFSPLVETVLKKSQRRVAELLDLDTGQRATSENFGENDHETHAWIREHQLDLLGVVEKGQIAVLCNDMIVVPAPKNSFDVLDDEQVRTNWYLAQGEPNKITGISPATDKTDTWFFRTREDGYGILQIVGQSDEPSGVKIRYKLLSRSGGGSRGQNAEQAGLPFVNDPPVLGEWESVDFVAKPSEFDPDQRAWHGELFLKGFTFLENGKCPQAWWTWTKGVVNHSGDKTASHYEIREIKGQPYLFFEWKGGDVAALGRNPSCYVLRKKTSTASVSEQSATPSGTVTDTAADWLQKLNEDQRAVLAWTDRQFRSFFDGRTFESWSAEERATLEKKLIDALNGPRSTEYYQAINTLGALRSTNALPKLRGIAYNRVDGNNRDRWMAIRALGLIGDQADVPELIHLVYHGNQNTHWWTQISLVRITGQNFGGDWNAWGKWWNDQHGQPAYQPEIIRWWNGQPEPDKLAASLAESDQKFLAGLKPK